MALAVEIGGLRFYCIRTWFELKFGNVEEKLRCFDLITAGCSRGCCPGLACNLCFLVPDLDIEFILGCQDLILFDEIQPITRYSEIDFTQTE